MEKTIKTESFNAQTLAESIDTTLSEKEILIEELLTKNIEGSGSYYECSGGACGTPEISGGGGCGGGGGSILVF